MRTSIRYALRFTLAIAILMSSSVLFPPSTLIENPYLSALSDLAITNALAAKPSCSHTTCSSGTCSQMSKSMTCSINGSGKCSAKTCLP